MTAMESSGLPFKITPQFVIATVLKRRWIILPPLFIFFVLGIYLIVALPRIYESKTLIIIEGQRVPQSYVQSIITEDTAQRISTISQQILSTSNLEKIIRNFSLFSGPEYERMFLEDKVANLRRRISVDVITNRMRETEAFTITFKDENPEKSMRVANGLASYFIDENLKVRETQAIGTSQFLDAELESMRKRLEEVEEAIKNYRKENMGELPEQLDTNLRILERLEENLSDRQQQLREAKIRLADLKNQTARNTAPIVIIGGADNAANPSMGSSLEELRGELKSLQSRYTEKHPDIQRLKKRIAELESDANNQSTSGDVNEMPPMSPELRAQYNDARREIQVTDAEIKELKNQIIDYQRRIEETPKREQQLLSLRRDYQNIQSSYESLLNRKLEADIAVNMERKQKGEQFRVVDPARLPQRPVEPDMRKIFLVVVLLGFGMGIGVSFLLEYLNTSFRSPGEIENLYGVEVLAAIPFFHQRKHIILKRINNAASVFVAGIVCVLFVVLGLMSLKGPEVIQNIVKTAGI